MNPMTTGVPKLLKKETSELDLNQEVVYDIENFKKLLDKTMVFSNLEDAKTYAKGKETNGEQLVDSSRVG